MTDFPDIETPAFVVDEVIALENIAAFQAHADAAGLKLRPHIKTHKLVHFAKAQMAAGAVGINCQKIGEAEVMADGGIDNILITYNILGAAKLARLRALAERVSELSVVADNSAVVGGLSLAFGTADRPLTVMVECDTGAARCGIQSPEEAAELARQIVAVPGLVFGGLMTYPPIGGHEAVVNFMRRAIGILNDDGHECPSVSSGGTPDMWSARSNAIISEYRIGTYIYNDRSLVERGTCGWDDCAGRVLATVVSTPAPGRAVIDAGSKVLTSDLLGLDGHGHVVDYPDVRIAALSEEHGVLDLGANASMKVGQRVWIIPNHVCVVSNMLDAIWLKDATDQLTEFPVDARGRVT